MRRDTNRSDSLSLSLLACAGAGVLAGAAWAQPVVQIFPTTPPEMTTNAFPWQSGAPAGITVHQVFASTLFSGPTAGAPARIDRVAFNGTVTGHVTVRLGYTNAIAGAPACSAGGLQIPAQAGNGVPNAVGTMATFFDGDVTAYGTGPDTFGMIYDGTPFVYNPAQGNLLLELYMPSRSGGGPARNAGLSLETSRTYQIHGGAASTALSGIQGPRVEFTFTAVAAACYANCDGSTSTPALNVQDFSCFLQKYASGDPYANCDGSTASPVLNVQDFSCFLTKYAGGCP